MQSKDEFKTELKKAHAAFDHLLDPANAQLGKVPGCPFGIVRSLGDFGETIGIDLTTNVGEGFVAAARVRVGLKRPKRDDWMLEMTVDRLSGSAHWLLGPDPSASSGAYTSVENLTGKDAYPHDRFISGAMRWIAARIGAEGHEEASRIFLETLQRGRGLGYPVFEARHLRPLAKRWSQGRKVERLEAGSWYLDGQVPEDGILRLYLFKAVGVSRSRHVVDGVFINTNEEGSYLFYGPKAKLCLPRKPAVKERGRTVRCPEDLALAICRHCTPDFIG